MSNISQNSNGEWVPAEPLKMRCEYRNCQSHEGKDYINPNQPKNWKGEPTFLCEKHAKQLGYVPMPEHQN